MVRIKLNGREVEVDGKDCLLKVCLDEGAFVPHYCWHPGLTPAGNCRMCLVKVSNSRKLEASCMYPVTEGLEVHTEGPEVDAGRKAVLEYMLINHPLDCPICDKAGECDLQDYTYRYRGGLSRFEEDKVIRHTKDLGPNIRIWGNRCIVCTRCVRFCDEVPGTGELCVVNRGDRSVVDAFPGIPVDNPLSLNVVDLCPVGALIDKNFLYSARVWFAKKRESVCASCSRGCNVEMTVLDNEIKRMVPRPNPHVNQHWMCDEGRLNHRYVSSGRRLRKATGSAREIAGSGRKIRLAGVLSTYATVEEMWLFRKLMEALQAGPVGFLTRSEGERQTFAGGFAIEKDKTPNRAYAARLFGEEAVAGGLEKVVAGLESGEVRGLFVMNGIPDFPMPAHLMKAARRAEFVAVSDILENPLAESAHVVLPGLTWAEKDGTFMNVDGRLQRVRKAVEPPAGIRPEVEWLQEALAELGARSKVLSAEGVFREAMPELDYGKVGPSGHPVNGHHAG
jgi:NADH-quinone oxidoreductase subunit G